MMCRLAANHVTELVEHGSRLVSLPDALGVPATGGTIEHVRTEGH